MNQSVDNENVKRWNFDSILEFGFICLIPIVLFILLISNLYKDFPNFDNLSIKRGILKKIGSGNYGKNSTWITLVIDGKKENIDIPVSKQVLRLNKEIENIIELRFDTGGEIWHISSEKNIYLDYNEKIRSLNINKYTNINILSILFIYTLLVYLKYYKIIKQYISNRNESDDKFNITEIVTFKHSNFNIGSTMYFLSLPTIILVYLGIFECKFFIIMSIPLLLILFCSYIFVLEHHHCMIISKNGIECELLTKKINTNFIKWSEIDSIDYSYLKGQVTLHMQLVDKNRIPKTRKILNLSSDIAVNISNFEKTHQLKNIITQQFNYSKK